MNSFLSSLAWFAIVVIALALLPYFLLFEWGKSVFADMVAKTGSITNAMLMLGGIFGTAWLICFLDERSKKRRAARRRILGEG